LNELAVLTGFRRFFAAVGSKKAMTGVGIAEKTKGPAGPCSQTSKMNRRVKQPKALPP
jgi:hypothetical protein